MAYWERPNKIMPLRAKSTISPHSSTDSAMGTVHMTCFPALSAAIESAPWVPRGY
jgi:hypothetical protein